MPGIPGQTLDVGSWKVQDNYVERLMDNAAYTSAHPDDTLVLAGPARANNPGTGAAFSDSLLAIGMVQNFSAAATKPTQPMMAVGSGRQFFVSGKASYQWNAARMFVNGRNLLRVLYTSAVQAGIDVSQFDDPAVATNTSMTTAQQQFWMNMDSELFYIPFGLAVLFRDKVHNAVGAFYMELCMINSWNIGFAAGQNYILESSAGVCDRVLPIFPDRFTGVTSTTDLVRSTLDTRDLGMPANVGSLGEAFNPGVFGSITSQ